MTTHAPKPRVAEHPEQNRIILLWGVVSVVILAIMLLFLRNYFFLVRNETVQRNYLSSGNPKVEALRAHEDSVLTSYSWVNRQAGVVSIPIERAMELVVSETRPGSGPLLVPGPSAATATPAVPTGTPATSGATAP
ncbi:MAG TPA: hypothetical protein VFP10_02300 [Candidatus Eisenbacteria bacterium]|nr:hypothetical protein [Candidatus Eisenbacteria bacterium]